MTTWKDIVKSPTNFFGALEKIGAAILGVQAVFVAQAIVSHDSSSMLPTWLLWTAIGLNTGCGYLARWFSGDNSEIQKLNAVVLPGGENQKPPPA